MFDERTQYALQNLPRHCLNAGRHRQAENLLTNLDFLEPKIHLYGAQATADDLTLLTTQDVLYKTLVRILHLLNRCDELPSVASTLRSHTYPISGLTHSHQMVRTSLPVIIPQQVLPDSNLPGLIRTFSGAENILLCGALSHDERWFAAGDDSGNITIWDAQSGSIARRLKVSDQAVNACHFDPTGELISASADVCWWDIDTGQLLHQYQTHGNVGCYSVSPAEHFAAFGVGAGLLAVWNRLADIITIFDAHQQAIQACAFSTKNDWMVSASADRTLKVWSLPNFELRHTLAAHTLSVRSCAISPDDKWIVSAGQDHCLIIWDAQTGQSVYTLDGHTSTVSTCCFVEQWLVSVSFDRYLHIWDTHSWRLLSKVYAHSHFIHHCFSAGHGRVMTVAFDQSARLWDIANIVATQHDAHSAFLCCDVNGYGAIAGTQSELVMVWDSLRHESGRFEGHTGGVSGCALASDSRWCVTTSGDHTLRVWNPANGTTRSILVGHNDFVWSCAISPDDRWILSSSQDATARLWDSVSGAEHTRFGHEVGVMKAVFSANVSCVATAAQDGAVRIWTQDGKLIHVLKGHQQWVLDCVFSSDGEFLISASRDHTLKLWITRTGDERLTLRGHQSAVTGCDISPDTQRIMSVETNGAIKIWDFVSGICLTTLHVDGTLNDCRFFSDGRRIMAVGSSGVYWLTI